MKQFKNVYELDNGYTKIFVIKDSKNILVDTGSRPLPDDLLDFMVQAGFVFDDKELRKELNRGSFPAIMDLLEKEQIKIDLIVCTHWHGDHAGNLKRLKEELNVPAAMHPADILFVDGTKKVPIPDRIPEGIRKYLHMDSCNVDICLNDKEYISDNVQVIHVEGHTRGSICLLAGSGCLISGDCLIGRNEMNPQMGLDELNPPVEMFCTDYPMALKNLSKLLAYDFKTILTGHGDSIADNGKEKLEELLQKIDQKINLS